jgi:stage II sporulation protein AB (anti-sigma F factor)
MAEINTAVSEAVTNAIVHAYPNGAGVIYISARIINGDTVEFVIRDKGEGILNVKQAMEPMYTTGGEDRSGMGFTIMQSFMDKVSVTSHLGKGTRVRLCKRISPRAAGGKK